VIKDGSIFDSMHVIASQGHLRRSYRLIHDITGKRSGDHERSPIRDLEEALDNSSHGIVWFWTGKEVRPIEYPFTRVWQGYDEYRDPKDVIQFSHRDPKDVIQFSLTRFQDDIGRFLRSNPTIKIRS